MVSNVRELFRRGAPDETFGSEMGVISMPVGLDGLLEGADLSVMAWLRPGHPRPYFTFEQERRGCPAPGRACRCIAKSNFTCDYTYIWTNMPFGLQASTR